MTPMLCGWCLMASHLLNSHRLYSGQTRTNSEIRRHVWRHSGPANWWIGIMNDIVVTLPMAQCPMRHSIFSDRIIPRLIDKLMIPSGLNSGPSIFDDSAWRFRPANNNNKKSLVTEWNAGHGIRSREENAHRNKINDCLRANMSQLFLQCHAGFFYAAFGFRAECFSSKIGPGKMWQSEQMDFPLDSSSYSARCSQWALPVVHDWTE